MKKITLFGVLFLASLFIFAACKDTTSTEDPTKEADTVATEAPTTAEPDTLEPSSNEDFVIEPVTLKTEPAEDITEDLGDIGEIPEEDVEIPEEIEDPDNGGEGIIPDETEEESSTTLD